MSAILTDQQVRELLKLAGTHRNNLLAKSALKKAAFLGAEIEREACAKVCEEMRGGFNWASENADIYHAQDHILGRAAAAIRARAGKEGG